MDLQVAAVDAVVVGDHEAGQLDVLVLDRLQGALERGADQVEAAEGAGLELLEFFLIFDPDAVGAHHPNLPLT